MSKFLNHCWQVSGTALSLVIIYCCGLIICLLIIPLLSLCSSSKIATKRKTQALIQSACKYYLKLLQSLKLIEITLLNPEAIPVERASLIVANHPTLLDVIIILALVPRLNLVAKDTLWEKPWLKGILTALECIKNDPFEDPHEFIRKCSLTIQEGDSLLIFPEGTRSPPRGLGRFHRSAAAIAIEGQHQILPIYIEASPPILTKEQPWYHSRQHKTSLRLLIMDSIVIKSPQVNEREKYTARKELTEDLQKIFSKQMQNDK